MSLQVAQRGDKSHQRHLWESKTFDYEQTCRVYGRNDSLHALQERFHVRGIPLSTEDEAKKLVRIANRATGGLNQDGEKERYTLKEAMATIEQVSNRCVYGVGVYPLIERRRHWAKTSRSKYATDQTRNVLNKICDVAFACHRGEMIILSHRRLAKMAGLHPTQISGILYKLEAAGQVFRQGFTAPYKGRERGTTRLSLKPPMPEPREDEKERPTWNPMTAAWEWSSSLAKGLYTKARWRWLTRRKAMSDAYMPNVDTSSSFETKTSTASAFQRLDNPLRGSP